MRLYKIYKKICCAAMLCAVLSGCGQTDAQDRRKDSEQVTYTSHAEDGTVLVQAQIQPPQYGTGDGAEAIDAYYDAVYANDRAVWEQELSRLAQDDHAQAVENGRLFHPYTVRETSLNVRDDEEYLSVQRIRYSDTGGAQEEQQVFCENFRKKDGTLI